MSIPTEYTMRLATASVDDALREHADRRLFFALRRFSDKVRRVIVRVVDLNGPRKGEDSRCTLQAELSDSSSIVVEATTAWPTASVTLACHRLKEAIRRHVAKTRRRERSAARRSRKSEDRSHAGFAIELGSSLASRIRG